MQKFNWIKKGLIFKVKSFFNSIKSRAMLPTPILFKNFIRVYYTALDKRGNSSVYICDLNIKDPSKIISIYKKPILEKGGPGFFDDSGALATSALRYKNKIYLYYNGYTKKITTPYSINIGLAISDRNGLNFKKFSASPILDRSKEDPLFTTGSCVIFKNKKFKMWYTSCTEWLDVNNKLLESNYCIKYAQSNDGINWHRNNVICLSSKIEAIAKPSVFFYKNLYHMFFCYRGLKDFRGGKDSYKIGYAYSNNGTSWIRKDKIGNHYLGIKKEWDDNMQCYPSIIKIKNKLFMFYNGNNFGYEGFGLSYLDLNY
jgi:hypothetical protein